MRRAFRLFSLFLFLSFLNNVYSTPEDPTLTFEHLYQYGKNEYTSGNWGDCVSFLLRALDDFAYYRDETLWCREKCARQIPDALRGYMMEYEPYMMQLSLMYMQAQRALCLLRCRIDKFTEQRPPLENYGIYEQFKQRKPFHYLQFCYWKMKDLKNAVKSAYTYLVANPENEDSLENVKFYMKQDGYDESMLVDTWQMPYERHYIEGVNAYKDEDWQKCQDELLMSLDELFEEENRCRMMCDDDLDWSSLQGDNPEYSVVITSIYTSVTSCRHNCMEKLSKVNGHKIKKFLASYFEYLHVCQFNLNRGRDAAQSVANALLLDKSNVIMRRNKLFYMKSYEKEDIFIPSEKIIEYYTRNELEKRFLEFIHDRFRYVDKMLPAEQVDDRKPFSIEVDIGDQFDYFQIEHDLLNAKECDTLRLAAHFPSQTTKHANLLIKELATRIEQRYGSVPKFKGIQCVGEPTRSGCKRSAFVLSLDTNRCSAFLADLYDGCVAAFCGD